MAGPIVYGLIWPELELMWPIPTLLPHFAVRDIYVKMRRLCDIPAAGGLHVYLL
jgi:hypothetical protein